MVSNQGSNEKCSQSRTKGGLHTVKETDMLVAKLDLLLKHLHKRAEFKKHRNNYAQAMNSYSTCKVCGDGVLVFTAKPARGLVRPGTTGLLIDIECSRVSDSSWMYITSWMF